MYKIHSTILAASIACAPFCLAIEPLEDSSDLYNEIKSKQILASLDQNKDGLIQESEDAKQWKRNSRYDINKDGALDISELKSIPKSYIDSPGKQIRNVLFKRSKTGDVFLDFYFPDVDDNKKKPVIIYTHGGGWAVGSKHAAAVASFHTVHKELLKQGFCVLSVDYRLVKKTSGTAMRDCVIDSQDAVRFVSAYHKELGIDPTRIFTFGDSAGGHIAQMVLLAPSDSIKGDPDLAKYSYKTVAGVSWYGPCDFQDEQLFNHDDRANFRDRFGPRILGADSKPEDKAELYHEMSPVSYLTKDSPPLLMIQGDKDTTIPVKQAHRMQEALNTIDAPVEILIVENAGHNWRSVDGKVTPNRKEIIEKTVEFIVKHK